MERSENNHNKAILSEQASDLLSASEHSRLPELVHSALTAGVVNPVRAVAQVIDQNIGAGSEKLIANGFANIGLENRQSAEFNTGDWYQQQLGHAIGSALPFLLARGLAKSAIAGSTETTIQTTVTQSFLRKSSDEAITSGTAGLIYGLLLTPNSGQTSSASEFVSQRLKTGLENAVLFGSIGFAAPMIGAALGSSANTVARSELPRTVKTPLSSVLDSPLSSGLATALTAGALAAEGTALKDGRALPTTAELKENLISMAFVGGTLGVIHKAATSPELKSASISQWKVQTETGKTSIEPRMETGPAKQLTENGRTEIARPAVIRELTSEQPVTKKQVKEYKLASSEEGNIRTLLSGETNYKLLGKMERGTRGAWMVEDPNGAQKIFKMVDWHNDVTPQINTSAQSAARLNSASHPTPRFERVEFTKPFGSWYVQEKLDGIPAPAPSDRLIGQMVRMNERQSGNAAGGKDWSDQIMSALHRDKFGWQNRIASASPEGAALVADLRKTYLRNSELNLRKNDIVHGDFQHYNALVSKHDRLTGYIDWEGAGKGDRSIDLSRLLYDAYVAEREIKYRANPETLKMLHEQIKDVSGRSARDSLMAYWILQVSDFGVKVGNPGLFFGVGRRIIDDIKADRWQYDFSRRVAQRQSNAALAMATALP
ncbi:MAG: aminoglycoside phosphotransferase family protein [Candidatus Obscuribacterales bacterium]|jgi:hypothetical protein|nr:aminoglycoside phosphotransferase family protein [Candidatus Obscuribacterales bacterium]